MANYLQRIIEEPTPQSEPLDDRMVPNNAGGYSYPVTDEVRMHRFLIIGSEDGSYYQKERKLTIDNANASKRHIAQAGAHAVDHIVDVALNRRAPRVAPTLLCLAIAASDDNVETRQAALQALPKVAATASNLEEFTFYVNHLRRWGRSLRNAVSNWYTSRDPKEVAFQAVKYRTRKGWSHQDMLRMAHPKAEQDSDLWHIFDWIAYGTIPPDRESLNIIHAFLKAQEETNPHSLAQLITEQELPWEAIPPEMLQHDQVWAALGHHMPPRAFVRNLPSLTAHNAIRPMEAQWAVDRIDKMRSGQDGRPAPVHPMNLLTAMMVYRMGHSPDGKSRWSPVPQISHALDRAFDRSFSAAPQTGQRVYLAVDVSGSMDWNTLGRISGLTAKMAAAAVCMAIARREPNHYIGAFSHQRMTDFNVTAQDSLRDVMERTDHLPAGATDMALPMLHAMENNIPVDCFVIATDGETYAGSIHPAEALRRYRQKMGIPAKAVQLAFVSNDHSIMDPDDAGTLDIAGFDAAIPTILHDFMVGPQAALPEAASATPLPLAA